MSDELKDDRITVRLNEKERADLELLKKTFHLENDSAALKLAVNWVNNYIGNVTKAFFPQSYDVVLVKKLKTQPLDRKVY